MTNPFKAGDRVTVVRNTYPYDEFKIGETYSVKKIENRYVVIDGPITGKERVMFADRVKLAPPAKVSFKDDLGGPFSGAYRTTEIKKTWIIAVLDNKGMPRPATKPQTYVSAAQAEKVAKEMAEKHAGETFMVLQGTAVAATPAVKSVELVRL